MCSWGSSVLVAGGLLSRSIEAERRGVGPTEVQVVHGKTGLSGSGSVKFNSLRAGRVWGSRQTTYPQLVHGSLIRSNRSITLPTTHAVASERRDVCSRRSQARVKEEGGQEE